MLRFEDPTAVHDAFQGHLSQECAPTYAAASSWSFGRAKILWLSFPQAARDYVADQQLYPPEIGVIIAPRSMQALPKGVPGGAYQSYAAAAGVHPALHQEEEAPMA